MSIVVVLPSRGRPQRAWEAIQAIRETAALVDTRVVLAVDDDDDELEAYRALRWPLPHRAEVSLVVLRPDETGDLVRATNTVSMRVALEDPTAIIGNLGDDHLCRTPGWDKAIAAALVKPGIAYGDDGLQGRHLPTAPFISAAIVLALGWYALPDCRHLFIDDAWRELAGEIGVLHYLAGVSIEHMHPGAAKADWDPGYRRANSSEMVEHDKAAFQGWRRTRRFRDDIARVRHALEIP